MQKYKKLVPIVAVILLAFGVNLEKFGIDLNALTGPEASYEASYSEPEARDDRKLNEEFSTNAPKAAAPAKVAKPASFAKLPHWSNSDPEINLWHVFRGEINRKGKPTGFHSRPGGHDPQDARVTSIKDRPNRAGVYTANIEVRDGGQWKSKFSSFFPDNLSQQEVVDVIVHAYQNSKNPNKQPWSGPSGLGFQVQGYTTSRGGINTAFPVYNRNQ